MNTISAPESSVGRISGSTTLKILRMPEQPRLSLASISELSMFLNAPETNMNTSEYSCKLMTMTQPLKP